MIIFDEKSGKLPQTGSSGISVTISHRDGIAQLNRLIHSHFDKRIGKNTSNRKKYLKPEVVISKQR